MIYINGKFLSQDITGVQRFAYNIARELLNNFDNYFILVPGNISISHLDIKQDKVIRVGVGSLHVWEQVHLLKFLKHNHHPLLLCFTGLGPVFYKNKITTIHDLSFWEHSEWFSKRYAYTYRLLTPITVKNSKKVLTVSDYSKKVIVKTLKTKPEKIEVVHNAVEQCNCEANHKNRDKTILAVGSLDPRKNLQRLIDAFIKWNNKQYKLVVIGGKQKSFSTFNLTKNENILFTGYVSDEVLHKYYNTANIFVYPSLYEGFGIPPLEAMAHGLPVIASNSTSLPEACGDAPFYINPLSTESIVDALKKVSIDEDLQSTMIKKGIKNVARFSWQKSAQEVNKIILSL